MISYGRLNVGLQVLSAENFCLGNNFYGKVVSHACQKTFK